MASTGNRYDTGETVSVLVGDKRASWNGGVFVGDPEVLDAARTASRIREEVRTLGTVLTADASEPLGALAAMASYAPGRVIVTMAPGTVIEVLESAELGAPGLLTVENSDSNDD